MDYVVNPAEFATAWALMLDIISLTCTTLVLYGLYIVLFISAIRALAQRNPPRRRALLLTTSFMFFLGTCGALVIVAMAGVAIRIIKGVVQQSSDLVHLTVVLRVLQLTDVVRVTLNNAVTDLLFLYPCYMIWGSKKKVLIVPALCILATVVLSVVVWLRKPDSHGGYLIDTKPPFIMSLGTNLLLMFLTAGRIWYKGRETTTILGPKFRTKYNAAIALILESGAMYCLCLVLWIASLPTLNSTTEFAALFSGITAGLVSQTV
ncbi:hypothetical protein GGX14DRAFT_450438, partial [Mycena pura]